MIQQVQRLREQVRELLAKECRAFENVGLLDATDTQRIVDGTKEAVALLTGEFAGLVAETLRGKLNPHVRREERGRDEDDDYGQRAEEEHRANERDAGP